MKKDDGGPVSGLTLRDYFAAKALTAIIAGIRPDMIFHGDVDAAAKEADIIQRKIPGVVRGAYAYADAMLAARATEV